MSALRFRRVSPDDAPRLQAIRRAAFAPIFASFRSLLGEVIYDQAQRRDDEAQEGLLTSLMAEQGGWELWVVEPSEPASDTIVGFVSLQLRDTRVGEIGLNAIDPAYAGQGFGSAMYEHALARMREAGMTVATVGTAGDPSHAPARRAYRKVGFDVELPTVWFFREL